MTDPITPPPSPRINVGQAGVFHPYGGDAERATVTRIWSDTCVNLETASGQLPTSVFVVYSDTPEANTPGSYFFTPDPAVAAPDAGPPPTDPV